LGRLCDQIRDAIREGRYVIGEHALLRLDERYIEEWQVIVGAESAKLLHERSDKSRNDVVELEQLLPDGTSFKAVWAWLPINKLAKLVTVHYFDE
jgi:hypothetical protein